VKLQHCLRKRGNSKITLRPFSLNRWLPKLISILYKSKPRLLKKISRSKRIKSVSLRLRRKRNCIKRRLSNIGMVN